MTLYRVTRPISRNNVRQPPEVGSLVRASPCRHMPGYFNLYWTQDGTERVEVMTDKEFAHCLTEATECPK